MKRSTPEIFTRLSTGTKMLLILSAAMLPFGFIALMTSLDMARSSQNERLASAQVATAMYAEQIESVLNSGLSAVRSPIASPQAALYLCDAYARQAQHNPSGRPPIALFDAGRRKICQSHGASIDKLATADRNGEHIWIDPKKQSFRLTAGRGDGSLYTEVDIPVSAIKLDIRQEQGLPLIGLSLHQGASSILLYGAMPKGEKLRTFSVPVGGGRLALVAEYKMAPARVRTALLVMMPILMWAAAAFTGWFIVSRLLLRPLLELKRSIDAFKAGSGVLRLPRMTTPSHEIRDLARSFATVSREIQRHELELEEGLARQTKLTREVHHRVKNNLQVISSLINLHARGATDDAADAYAAIQRRVDALAVVHRNHYAELEENRGVSIRALTGELATSLRASAPAAAGGMPIALNVIDVNVTQDVAVPVAFLITEVVELLMHCNPQGSVLISLEFAEQPDRANLRIETLGMAPDALEAYPGIIRFDRVVTGLARQFRAPLVQDRTTGSFQIQISVIV